MSRAHRLPGGGRIDRKRPVRFGFDGVEYEGFAGDTLASALLANGVDGVWRSLYRDRPRGVFAAGADDPNTLVQVERPGSASEPMLRATTVELVDGLVATSLRGKGRLETRVDTSRFDHRYTHVDVLVVGGGPAGIAAAVAAGRTGARVLLVDEGAELGGSLRSMPEERLDGRPGWAWIEARTAETSRHPETRILTRATALGLYDHGWATVAQRLHGPVEGRLWHVRAKRVVLATGALERPVAFRGNDRPGVMLASAARTYVERFAVAPGERAVVFTTNDSGYDAALSLARAGIDVAAVVDARTAPAAVTVARAREAHIPVHTGALVAAATGDDRVVSVAVRTADGMVARIPCDLLAVSGGWNPAIHLWSHVRGTTCWDEAIQAFVPDQPAGPIEAAGALTGSFSTGDAIRQGFAAGVRAAALAGFEERWTSVAPEITTRAMPVAGRDEAQPPLTDVVAGEPPIGAVEPLFVVPAADGAWDELYVDLERDATVADVHRAVGAGLRSVEHIKRYTTIGTASDQGRTSGVIASAVAAELLGSPMSEAGLTTFRPPYIPASFAQLAGRDRGVLSDPVRTTAIQPWHLAHGAPMENVGQWHRPWYFPLDGESIDEAVLRETRAVRGSVGVMDASTLGKIDLQGRDVGVFLDRIYTNRFSTLKVGSCRYGLMCRADGMVFDDGVTSRIADDRFHMTTTTGNAAAVLDWLEEWLQTEWPELRVRATSVTEQWATVAVVGPRSRDVVAAVCPGLDVSREAFPFMTWREAEVAGVPGRVFRISFSGELAYELNVGWSDGRRVWEAVMAAGAPFGITPYGTESMHVLRAEKGYPIIGQDTDGTVTPQDLGMDWIVAPKPFIGSRSHQRSDTARPDRKQFVGLLPVDPDALIPEGAQLVTGSSLGAAPPVPMLGHVTSSYHSAALGRTFALAMLKGGRDRIGEVVHAPLGDRVIAATVTSSVLFDPENARRDGKPEAVV